MADAVDVRQTASERFTSDPGNLPSGWQLIEGATDVEVGEARRAGDSLEVDVVITGMAAPIIQVDEVIERSAGLSADDAEAELAELGTASVELWPGWAATVPTMDWRVEVRIADPEAAQQ